jgi:uncharacterized membrane protein YraQ (UPF0718 family)
MAELTALFLGISTIVSLILMYIPQNKLRDWLSRRGIIGNFLGAIIGALTPFCACSTIPLTLGLLNAGAPFGPVMSFVIASPLLNPIILGIIVSLMGIKACLLYFTVTFFGAIIFGVTLEKIGASAYVKNVRMKNTTEALNSFANSYPFKTKLRMAFASAWKDFSKVFIFLIIGVGVGAAIYGYIPQDFIASIAGPHNKFAIPVAAFLGVPLYIRAETAIPIGMALAQKGMSMGAVIALIIGGAGMAIPEMSMMASIFRK